MRGSARGPPRVQKQSKKRGTGALSTDGLYARAVPGMHRAGRGRGDRGGASYGRRREGTGKFGHTKGNLLRGPRDEARSLCFIAMDSEDDAPQLHEPIGQTASPAFRPQNLRCVNTLTGHHSGIRAIAWRTGRVFTGSYDNTIKVWNLDGGSCEATLEGHVAWIRSLFCHFHEPLLFSGSDDGEIKIWRTDNYAQHGSIASVSPGGILAINVDYERAWLLAGTYDSSICVYALPECELLHVCSGHRSAVRSLMIFNDCLLSGSYDRTVKLWDLAGDCKCIGSLGTRGSVWALTVHDGMLLGAVGDSSIKVRASRTHGACRRGHCQRRKSSTRRDCRRIRYATVCSAGRQGTRCAA